MADNWQQTAVVFDLDDTLYKEADYQASGLREVCNWVEEILRVKVEFDALPVGGKVDSLLEICRLARIPPEVKESLRWIYRLHLPSIALDPETQDVLNFLHEKRAAVAVLTDGRSITQRQKIKALGLEHLPVYVSEEHRSVKPDGARFIKIMSDFPVRKYVYVADNPIKDFLAPNALGWKTVGLRGDKRNIHAQATDGLSREHLPNVWIDRLNELISNLC